MGDTLINVLAHCGGADSVLWHRSAWQPGALRARAELVHLEEKFARTRAEAGDPQPLISISTPGSRTASPAVRGLGWERTAKTLLPDIPVLTTHGTAEDAEEV